MIIPEDTRSATNSPSTTKEELEAAGKVLAGLLLARKNSSLYPEGHSICMNSFEQFHRLLDTYLCSYESLKFYVEKDQLIFKGESIYSASPEDGELPFTLFRDGIVWLEFLDGIDLGEIQEFLAIINKYSMLADEPEGDIVTAFWEIQLPHIRYEVIDFFWGGEQEVDLKESSDTQKGDSTKLRESDLVNMEPPADPPIHQNELVLTPEEKRMIGDMVILEEKQEPTAYLDALIDSLLEHQEQDNFDIILDMLAEEFQDSLTRTDFVIALKILQTLRYVHDNGIIEIPWATSLIEDFFLRVSSPKSLKPLHNVWRHIDSDQADKIKQILVFLQPEAIHTLGGLLLQNPSVRLQKLLMEVLIRLSSRDIQPLESLLKSSNEDQTQRLVHVLVNLKCDRSLTALMKLIRHSSDRVRQEALRGLLQRDPARIKDMFNLIDDKDASVRNMILKNMGRSRNIVAEKLLRNYLEHREFKKTDDEHVIACFKTLGKCGSPYSVPFLSRTLLDQGLLSGFRKSAYREGAAFALSMMGIKEAQQVLEKAKRSLYPGVRSLARRVLSEKTSAKEGGLP